MICGEELSELHVFLYSGIWNDSPDKICELRIYLFNCSELWNTMEKPWDNACA